MGFLRETILQKSKQKSQTSSALPKLSTSAPSSSESTPRPSYSPVYPQNQRFPPDSYEAFMQEAERKHIEDLEQEDIEERIQRRNASFSRGDEKKENGARPWLIANGLSR